MVMNVASQLQVDRGVDDPFFDAKFIAYVHNRNGIIPIHEYEDIPDSPTGRMNSLIESGNLSQEMGGGTGDTPQPDNKYHSLLR